MRVQVTACEVELVFYSVPDVYCYTEASRDVGLLCVTILGIHLGERVGDVGVGCRVAQLFWRRNIASVGIVNRNCRNFNIAHRWHCLLVGVGKRQAFVDREAALLVCAVDAGIVFFIIRLDDNAFLFCVTDACAECGMFATARNSCTQVPH